ncbi:FKBP-type peptidyl-prolyl cis-trans isomerase [Tribonema minus]|uniref:peptidylprolyl isomerase n=1 Tax=Tribonema minus TaxID=303371 RepID=A0A835YXV4_9STRA|nr:FKBP-type peptidyl-prolyl cis-trans isomerase [Tribonema minus]
MKLSSFFSAVALFVFALATALAGTTQEGLDFLAANKAKEGVVELPSGLQYKVVASGDPKGPKPGPSTPCECHYKGTTIKGDEFDSSFKRGRPAVFAPNQVIKGWTEAMQLMHEGDHWELFIPSELAYGDARLNDLITPGAVLVFELQMLKVLNGDGDDEL